MIPSDMSRIPVKALGKEARDLISSLLNPVKIFLADNKLPRDWRGLAVLCGIGGELMPSIRSENPVRNILKIWSEKNATESTIDKLLYFLEQLDRYDVLDDITPYVEKDVEYYKLNPRVVSVDPVASDDEDILTYEDAERKMERKPLLTYDAFVLFDNEDEVFATDIVEELEGKYNMKLCVKDRDLCAGKLEHISVIKLITMRCKKTIVVLSNAFLRSLINRSLYHLAEVDGLEKHYKKTISCMKEPYDIPTQFRMYHTLIVTRCFHGTFWIQLVKSVRKGTAPPNDVVISEGNQNTTPEKSAKPTKPVNHVECSTPSVPAVSRQEDSKKSLRKGNFHTNFISDELILTNNSSDDNNTEILKEQKKKLSFKKMFNKIINPKSKKQGEISLRKKGDKKKMVLAN